MSGKRDERCRGCLGYTVDNLGDIIVDVLLANVPSASTLPGARVELGQHAWGLAMSEWLDKAGEAKRWKPKPSLYCTDHSESNITSSSTAGGCHHFYSFTAPSKEVNTASGCVDSCKHFPCWLILQNKTFLHICGTCHALTMSFDSTAGWGTLLYISCCVSAAFSLPCFMVMRFTEVSNTALGVFPSPSAGQKRPTLRQLQM